MEEGKRRSQRFEMKEEKPFAKGVKEMGNGEKESRGKKSTTSTNINMWRIYGGYRLTCMWKIQSGRTEKRYE